MRRLINYLRSCFCKHDWEMIFDITTANNSGDAINKIKIYRCKKCGMEKRYTAL